MNVGFIGTGKVGGTLAKSLGAKGHTIYLSSRDPRSFSVKNLAGAIGVNASVYSIQEVILKSDIIIMATPWASTASIVQQFANQLEEKILIDCTNPLKPDLSGLELGHTTSGGEVLQALVPKAKIFKAFNTTGFNISEFPVLESRKAVMFFCGDDSSSRHIVRDLVDEVGFEAVDAGPMASARLLEPFALLWIQCAYKFGLGRDFAFGLLRKNSVHN
ncbi:MAG: NAD(P)-binding domain-containing protein [Proteobacteria bacterium]|jgi:hypothetical protein|nr:NAD(P)-binding domain-containing protein [Pseudomonadota bacterium]